MIISVSSWEAVLVGAMLGLAFGTGVFLITVMNPWTRPRSVESRIDPYVRRGEFSRLFSMHEHTWLGHPFLQRNVMPSVRAIVHFVGRVIGSYDDVDARLRRAGLSTSVSAYRLEQALWALAGFVTATIVAIALAAAHKASVTPLFLGVLIATLIGLLARDHYLTRQVKKRAERLAREFPTAADLLALAVAAGESPVAAMERVAKASHGALATELGITVADIRSGMTVDEALIRLGKRTPLTALSRFSEAVAVALERGTPLADVLRAQAQDARDHSTRELMEAAGKREISMLLPVVFFLMPLVIVFAIFPGLSVLRIGI